MSSKGKLIDFDGNKCRKVPEMSLFWLLNLNPVPIGSRRPIEINSEFFLESWIYHFSFSNSTDTYSFLKV